MLLTSLLIYILLNIIIQTKDLKNLKKLTTKYSAKSLRRVVYKTAEDAGKAAGGSKGKPDGLIAERYQGTEDRMGLFNAPVRFTLSSVYWKAEKNNITFHTFNQDGKGTSPAKYLFPAIGGNIGGLGDELPLKFDKWLWNRKYAGIGQWPLPAWKNKEFIKKTPEGNVRPQVYRDTQIALNKTKNDKLHRKADGPRIQDGRVFSKTATFGGNGKRYQPGIYRVKTNDANNFIKPLFFYGKQDKIPQYDSWPVLVSKIVREYIMKEDRIKKNIELYAEKN
tara:strand:+ start:94 stop:930 length:837 start_codon:yes stop_codon:yes gene_type:complete